MVEGRIQKALSGFYYVDTGSELLTCRARGKFRKDGISPLVGDRVEVRELGNGDGFLEKSLRGVAIKIFVGNEARAYPIAKVGIVSDKIALTTQKIERLVDGNAIEPGINL